MTAAHHTTAHDFIPSPSPDHAGEVIQPFTPSWFAVTIGTGVPAIGLATIIYALRSFGMQRWGAVALELAHGLWWLDAGLAVACGLTAPFLVFKRQGQTNASMNPVWLLPLIALEAATLGGSRLAAHLANPADRMALRVACDCLWACSVLVALSVLAIFFPPHRAEQAAARP
jgi:tellurite resistance protein TehA-like permease